MGVRARGAQQEAAPGPLPVLMSHQMMGMRISIILIKMTQNIRLFAAKSTIYVLRQIPILGFVKPDFSPLLKRLNPVLIRPRIIIR